MTTVPERHAALRSLELTVLRRLDGILHGDYRGFIPGHGSELGEARVYAPGDDVRRIDWNVTARTGEPHIRDTVADHELETTILVDLSGSMSFGTATAEKRDLAIAAAAGVGYLALGGGNRVGSVVLEGAVPRRIPPRSGRRHLQGIVFSMLSADREQGPGDLAHGLRSVDRHAVRRGLVVVISDFLDAGEWHRPLRALTTRHDVIAIEVIDPRELQLVDVGTITMVDTEDGRRRWVDTGSAKVRRRFAAAAAEQRTTIKNRLLESGVDHLTLRTDRDWVADLVRHIARRRRGQTTGRTP